MNVFLRISSAIDRVSDALGKLVGILTLMMVLVGALNASLRYAGQFVGQKLTPDTSLDIQWNLFSMIFLLGAPYALRRGVHVRVDVLYGRFSGRVKAWLELVGTVLLLLPLCITMLWFSWPSIRTAWDVGERMSNAGAWPVYPIKSCILLGFALLIVQACSEMIKNVAYLRGKSSSAGEDQT